MGKFLSLAVPLAFVLATAASASAGVTASIADYSKSDDGTAIDLTADGSYYWAVWDEDVDDDADGGYEATDWKSGMTTIEVTANHGAGYTGSIPPGGGGVDTNPDHAYGKPEAVPSSWGSGNDQANTNFNWTDGTNVGSASNVEPNALRHHQNRGLIVDDPWVVGTTAGRIREGWDSNGDTVKEWPVFDADYPSSLSDYESDPDYDFSVVAIPVPVPAGDATVLVYFNDRRTSFILGGELSVDGDAGDTGHTGNGQLSGTGLGDKVRYIGRLEVTGATQAQDLLVTLTTQTVGKDANRRFSLQAVSATPEPATLGLMALGGLGVLVRRKR